MSLKVFTLLSGQYIGADYTAAPGPDGVYPSRTFNRGEDVVSPTDLVVDCVNMFRFKGDYAGPVAKAAPPTAPPKNTYTEDQLNAKTVAELRQMADEEEVDLSEAHNKSQIVAAILGK